MSTRRTKNRLRTRLGLPVKTGWTLGPRTATWVELWRRILADVLPNNENVTNDAAQGPDEPVDVNTPEQMGRCNGSGGS